MDETSFKYDIAFSFLAQDEALALELNDLLQDRFKTFLYSKRQGEIAGTDGEETFNAVFGEQARVVVVLYRAGWGETPWTRIEQTAIRNRAFEQGYDFVKFIPLDDPPTIPKWFPRTQLWLGFRRWGITGAASAIEARIQECGGEPREETVSERAARLQRSLEFAEKKKRFLSSEEGVNAGNQEFDALHSQLLLLTDAITKTAPTITLQVKRSGRQKIVILGFGLGLSVEWHYRYTNSLDDAELCLDLWDRHPPFPGIMHFDRPNRLNTVTFQFDLSPSGEYRWNSDIGGGHSFLTKDLADFMLKYFMDEGQKAKGNT